MVQGWGAVQGQRADGTDGGGERGPGEEKPDEVRPMNLKAEDGWVRDELREAARRTGAAVAEQLDVGGPIECWCRAWCGGPWMKRRQQVVTCAICQTSMPAGPDYWSFCAHNQSAGSR